jgi:uncharacterized membrane protein YfcA
MAGVDSPTMAGLAIAALFAGFIDAVVGGGGLIQIPALFNALPRELPATIFGTNKFSSVLGTSNAAWRYARRVQMPWRTTLPAAVAAFSCSYVGAMAVVWLPPAMLRPLILVMLIAAAAYTFGDATSARFIGRSTRAGGVRLRVDFGRRHRIL